VIPFRVDFVAGEPAYEQVVYAAKKAILAEKIRPGQAFPSVRALARELKLHANTAQKVIAHLTSEGLLEVRPGVGTIVVKLLPVSRGERGRLLKRDIEQLTVEAMQLGMSVEELQGAIADRWRVLSKRKVQAGT